MDLTHLTDFNLVAYYGGFGLASRASGRPKATLSRHVLALEKQLDVRLLERSGHAFRLSDEGKALHERTHNLVDEIIAVTRDLREKRDRPSGKLRVSSPVTFGQSMMGRLGAEFIRRYPDVQLEVTIEDREVDLIEEGYDVVIRVNPQPDSELVGRCFAQDTLLLVSSPLFSCAELELKKSIPATIPIVPAVVGIKAPQVGTWTVSDGIHTRTFSPQAILRLATPLMVRDAVLTGVGMAVLAHNLVSKDLAEQRLISWGTVLNQSVSLWVLHTSRRLTNSKVSAFVQFLCNTPNILSP
ncbi:MAG: LysR family transcriptional regulator [Thiothrix sp.]|nr:MAG: LysR family transcriptional regulator [Thiothrix sp.]